MVSGLGFWKVDKGLLKGDTDLGIDVEIERERERGM